MNIPEALRRAGQFSAAVVTRHHQRTNSGASIFQAEIPAEGEPAPTTHPDSARWLGSAGLSEFVDHDLVLGSPTPNLNNVPPEEKNSQASQ